MKRCPKCLGRKQYYSSRPGFCSLSNNGAPLVDCDVCGGLGVVPPKKEDYGLECHEALPEEPVCSPAIPVATKDKKRRGRPPKALTERV